MKKLSSITAVFVIVVFIVSLISNPVSAQTTKSEPDGSKLIPEGVMKIVDNSCMKCHMEPGNKLALSQVNFSKWDTYSTEKQAAKAKSICKIVTKGKMPPKNFKNEHPDAVLTQEQITTICDWSQSLQPAEK